MEKNWQGAFSILFALAIVREGGTIVYSPYINVSLPAYIPLFSLPIEARDYLLKEYPKNFLLKNKLGPRRDQFLSQA